MVEISRETYRNNSSGGILWLNEEHKKEGLDHKDLRVTAAKYLSGYRKHRNELVDIPKNNPAEFLYAKN